MKQALQHPAIVIPAYQPDEQLLKLVQELRRQRAQQLIIVVNDGSSSDVAHLFTQLSNYQVEILHHSQNLGKGQALKTAFLYYLNLIGDAALGVVTADADGQHSVEDILALSDALAQSGQHLHLGVRDFTAQSTHSTQIPWRSRIGNLLTGYILTKLCATPLKDTQTGLRGIPIQLLKTMLQSAANGYELEMEMLLIAARQGILIQQIPIKTIYFNRNSRSHFNPLRDSFRIYWVVVRFILFRNKKVST
jgi:glycosyltransferase involved in cell wall biosynthesis